MRKPSTLRDRLLEAAFVTVVVTAGVAMRARYLDANPFWVDEAESSINALTILQHGYPVDHYLGIPIFENTLVKPWPGNPEYEFKDISYSDRGIAIYHGWLPLYAIAASFALHGIRPDQAGGDHHPRTLEEMKRRTRAARLPSLVFGALFLAICYIAGSMMYGRDAGTAALLMTSILTFHVEASIQARYYSALIALSTCAVLVLWLILTKGGFRHYVAGAVVMLLIFHTHLVTFAAAAVVLILLMPVMFVRHRDVIRKLLVFGAILLTGVVPWVAGTGFLSGVRVIPPARTLLSLPADWLRYPVGRTAHVVIFSIFLLVTGSVLFRRLRLPFRFAKPLQDAAAPMVILALWILAAYGAFFAFMPAVSFDASRLKFPYWGPAVLLASIFSAALARAIAPRFSIYAAPALACFLAFMTGVNLLTTSRRFGSWESITALRAYLEQSRLPENAKLYALPNSHLLLSFYLGLPFQSIYPVRKSFLDAFPAEVVFIDFDEFRIDQRNESLAPERLRQSALQAGEELNDADGQLLSKRLRTLKYRSSMSGQIGGLPEKAVERVPAYAEPLLRDVDTADAALFGKVCAQMPVLRGFRIASWHEWVGTLVYRFVNPEVRIGPELNYAERLRGAEADILTDTGWVIYRSSPNRNPNAAVMFRLLP